MRRRTLTLIVHFLHNPFCMCADSAYPATSPNQLASFVRIKTGEAFATQAQATSQVFYVIRSARIQTTCPRDGLSSVYTNQNTCVLEADVGFACMQQQSYQHVHGAAGVMATAKLPMARCDGDRAMSGNCIVMGMHC